VGKYLEEFIFPHIYQEVDAISVASGFLVLEQVEQEELDPVENHVVVVYLLLYLALHIPQ
jgi:hypothetical protein